MEKKMNQHTLKHDICVNSSANTTAIAMAAKRLAI